MNIPRDSRTHRKSIIGSQLYVGFTTTNLSKLSDGSECKLQVQRVINVSSIRTSEDLGNASGKELKLSLHVPSARSLHNALFNGTERFTSGHFTKSTYNSGVNLIPDLVNPLSPPATDCIIIVPTSASDASSSSKTKMAANNLEGMSWTFYHVHTFALQSVSQLFQLYLQHLSDMKYQESLARVETPAPMPATIVAEVQETEETDEFDEKKMNSDTFTVTDLFSNDISAGTKTLIFPTLPISVLEGFLWALYRDSIRMAPRDCVLLADWARQWAVVSLSSVIERALLDHNTDMAPTLEKVLPFLHLLGDDYRRRHSVTVKLGEASTNTLPLAPQLSSEASERSSKALPANASLVTSEAVLQRLRRRVGLIVTEILASVDFYRLSAVEICALLEIENLVVAEADLFVSLLRWAVFQLQPRRLTRALLRARPHEVIYKKSFIPLLDPLQLAVEAAKTSNTAKVTKDTKPTVVSKSILSSDSEFGSSSNSDFDSDSENIIDGEDDSSVGLEMVLPTPQLLRKAMLPFLHLIRFDSIHPYLLRTVVAPTRILTADELRAVFTASKDLRRHPLHSATPLSLNHPLVLSPGSRPIDIIGMSPMAPTQPTRVGRVTVSLPPRRLAPQGLFEFATGGSGVHPSLLLERTGAETSTSEFSLRLSPDFVRKLRQQVLYARSSVVRWGLASFDYNPTAEGRDPKGKPFQTVNAYSSDDGTPREVRLENMNPVGPFPARHPGDVVAYGSDTDNRSELYLENDGKSPISSDVSASTSTPTSSSSSSSSSSSGRVNSVEEKLSMIIGQATLPQPDLDSLLIKENPSLREALIARGATPLVGISCWRVVYSPAAHLLPGREEPRQEDPVTALPRLVGFSSEKNEPYAAYQNTTASVTPCDGLGGPIGLPITRPDSLPLFKSGVLNGDLSDGTPYQVDMICSRTTSSSADVNPMDGIGFAGRMVGILPSSVDLSALVLDQRVILPTEDVSTKSVGDVGYNHADQIILQPNGRKPDSADKLAREKATRDRLLDGTSFAMLTPTPLRLITQRHYANAALAVTDPSADEDGTLPAPNEWFADATMQDENTHNNSNDIGENQTNRSKVLNDAVQQMDETNPGWRDVYTKDLPSNIIQILRCCNVFDVAFDAIHGRLHVSATYVREDLLEAPPQDSLAIEAPPTADLTKPWEIRSTKHAADLAAAAIATRKTDIVRESPDGPIIDPLAPGHPDAAREDTSPGVSLMARCAELVPTAQFVLEMPRPDKLVAANQLEYLLELERTRARLENLARKPTDPMAIPSLYNRFDLNLTSSYARRTLLCLPSSKTRGILRGMIARACSALYNQAPDIFNWTGALPLTYQLPRCELVSELESDVRSLHIGPLHRWIEDATELHQQVRKLLIRETLTIVNNRRTSFGPNRRPKAQNGRINLLPAEELPKPRQWGVMVKEYLEKHSSLSPSVFEFMPAVSIPPNERAYVFPIGLSQFMGKDLLLQDLLSEE